MISAISTFRNVEESRRVRMCLNHLLWIISTLSFMPRRVPGRSVCWILPNLSVSESFDINIYN